MAKQVVSGLPVLCIVESTIEIAPTCKCINIEIAPTCKCINIDIAPTCKCIILKNKVNFC